MNLHKIFLIASREFNTNIRRRMFLFTTFIVPLISIGISFGANVLVGSQFEDKGGYARVGIVDPTGILTGLTPPKPYEIVSGNTAQDEQAAGRLPVYYVLPASFLQNGTAQTYSTASLPGGLNDDFFRTIKALIGSKGGNPEIVARLQEPYTKQEIRKLGSTQVYEESVLFSSFFGPLIFVLILFVAIQTTSQYLMSGVVEEKENRMMELLVTSSRPGEMLWGKVLGLGAIGLTQILVWAGAGLIYILSRGVGQFGVTLASLNLSGGIILLMLAYFLLGYLFNGMLMAGIGASSSVEAESRQIAGLLNLLYAFPFFFIIAFISDPNSVGPVILSMIPFTAPLSMIMRTAFTSVPPVEIALSLLILFASTVIVAWVSGRVFRVGMLAYGKRLSLRDIFRALREANPVVIQKEIAS